MLRVMLVGSGGIAPAHIEGFLSFPQRVRITVLAATNSQRAKQLCEEYSLDCRIVSDFKQGLADCDIVSICTPPSSHRDIAVECLNAGCHVLLEKPMAPTLSECDDILAAAVSAKKLISVVAQSRFISSIANAIALVKSGDYGKLLYTSVNSLWYRGSCYHDLVWRGRWETEGGGCTMGQAIHHIDLLLWAKGMPDSVMAVTSNLAHENSQEEDISISLLQYPDGSLAQLTCSMLHHGEQQSFNFQTEQAGISIPFGVCANSSRSNGFPADNEAVATAITQRFNSMPTAKWQNHDGQILNLLNAIEGNEPLVSDGVSGRAAIELIMAIYLSGMTSERAKLPLKKDCGFYSKEDILKNAVHYHEKTRSVDRFEDTFITSFKGKF